MPLSMLVMDGYGEIPLSGMLRLVSWVKTDWTWVLSSSALSLSVEHILEVDRKVGMPRCSVRMSLTYDQNGFGFLCKAGSNDVVYIVASGMMNIFGNTIAEFSVLIPSLIILEFACFPVRSVPLSHLSLHGSWDPWQMTFAFAPLWRDTSVQDAIEAVAYLDQFVSTELLVGSVWRKSSVNCLTCCLSWAVSALLKLYNFLGGLACCLGFELILKSMKNPF